MKQKANTNSGSPKKSDPADHRKGREQREAAERGRTIGFYIKELARKALLERGKSRHFGSSNKRG